MMKRWILALMVLFGMIALLFFLAGYFGEKKEAAKPQAEQQLDAELLKELRQEAATYWQEEAATGAGVELDTPITPETSDANTPPPENLPGEEEKAVPVPPATPAAAPEKQRLSVEGNYALSLGSFSTESNARRYQAQMAKQGYSTVIKHGKSGYWLVIIDQGWASKQAAAQEQLRLKKNGRTSVLVWGF